MFGVVYSREFISACRSKILIDWQLVFGKAIIFQFFENSLKTGLDPHLREQHWYEVTNLHKAATLPSG